MCKAAKEGDLTNLPFQKGAGMGGETEFQTQDRLGFTGKRKLRTPAGHPLDPTG